MVDSLVPEQQQTESVVTPVVAAPVAAKEKMKTIGFRAPVSIIAKIQSQDYKIPRGMRISDCERLNILVQEALDMREAKSKAAVKEAKEAGATKKK